MRLDFWTSFGTLQILSGLALRSRRGQDPGSDSESAGPERIGGGCQLSRAIRPEPRIQYPFHQISLPSKVEQTLGDKLRAAFYFQRTNTSTPRTATGADDLPNDITGSAVSANSGRTIRLNPDYTATPRLLMQATFGWNDSHFLLQSQNYPYSAQQALGIPGQTLRPL